MYYSSKKLFALFFHLGKVKAEFSKQIMYGSCSDRRLGSQPDFNVSKEVFFLYNTDALLHSWRPLSALQPGFLSVVLDFCSHRLVSPPLFCQIIISSWDKLTQLRHMTNTQQTNTKKIEWCLLTWKSASCLGPVTINVLTKKWGLNLLRLSLLAMFLRV